MKFANVMCSNCGCSFGPGDSGFSHCEDHKGIKKVRHPDERAREVEVWPELAPCKKCGCKADYFYNSVGHRPMRFTVECLGCRRTTWLDTRKEAAEHWNATQGTADD